MTPSDDPEDDHHLRVYLEDVRLARFGDATAIARIESAAHEFVCLSHASDLSPEAREEIVRAAMADAWELLAEGCDAADVRTELRRSLERHKKTEKRRRARVGTAISVEDLRLEDATTDPENALAEREHARAILRAVRAHLSPALRALCELDHDLLRSVYELPPTLFPPRLPQRPQFSSLDAGRRALSRARLRFNANLQRRVLRDLHACRGDRTVLLDTMSYLRGGMTRGAIRLLFTELPPTELE